MFGPRAIPGLSFTRMIGGISKTLGVINQIIPIYKEAKPMINNARNALSIIKEFGNTTTNRVMTKKDENLKVIKESINKINNNINNNLKNSKGPTFFQ